MFRSLKVFSNIFVLIVASIVLLPNIVVNSEIQVSPYNSNKASSSEKNWFIFQSKAGDTVRDSILIKNNSDQDSLISLTSKDTQILEDGTFTIIPDSQENKASGNWVKIDVNQLSIPAKKSSQVSFKVEVPKDTPDGEYSAGIGIIETKKNDSQVNVTKRYGLRIYITVGEKLILDVKPEKLNILDPNDANYEAVRKDKPYFGRNNMLIEYQAENIGNVYGIINGKYSVSRNDGSVFEGTFSSEIAPKTGKKTYYINTNQNYSEGKNQAIVDFRVEPQNVNSNLVKNIKPKTALGDIVELSQNDWNKFPNSTTLAFTTKPEITLTNEQLKKPVFNETLLLILCLVNIAIATLVFLRKKLYTSFNSKVFRQ